VAPGDASITIDNTDPQNPIVIGNTNSLSLVYQATAGNGVGTINALSSRAFSFSQAVGTIFEDYLANGAPEATGVFMIDLSSITFSIQGNGTVGAQNEITVAFMQGTNTYTSDIYLNRFILPTGNPFPFAFNLGQVYFNVEEARAAGLTAVQAWVIINGTNGSMTNSSFGSAYAQYFPLGLQ
jgi:hypothetical protein